MQKSIQLNLFEPLLELPYHYPDIPLKPKRIVNVIELFAGAVGLALGLEQAGLKTQCLVCRVGNAFQSLILINQLSKLPTI